MKKRALISVSDKSGIVDFCKQLIDLGFEIISTGGTLKTLEHNGISAVSISDVTNFPECLDGRVKTLHPSVHAGLLAMRKNKHHMQQLKELNIQAIDLICVNLYPFKKTVSNEDVDFADAVENIDIGGPAMLRSAAKNYQDVIALCDPNDYDTVIAQLKEKNVSLSTRKYLMYKVFAHTAFYDSIIADYLLRQNNIKFPENIVRAYEKCQDLRYGENPHQKAAFYRDVFPQNGSIVFGKQLQGKELSYNNINDSNGAIDILREFFEPCVVAVKHSNPCGVGIGRGVYDAYTKAYSCDPISIFGGIVATNCEIDKETALEMVNIFLEVILAPKFSDEALEVFSAKSNLRLIQIDNIAEKLKKEEYDFKKVVGGLLVQEYNTAFFDRHDMKVVTKNNPTQQQMDDMKFAMKICKHAKSNAIVIARDGMTVGIGNGQTNRIWATQQAIEHAKDKLAGAVVASDAFFPFADCVEEINAAGIKAIMQPGGSIRDNDSIEACDKYGISMVFTGKRHFKH